MKRNGKENIYVLINVSVNLLVILMVVLMAWDIYRESRTNTNEYRANKYKGALNVVNKKLTLDATHAFSSVFDAEDRFIWRNQF